MENELLAGQTEDVVLGAMLTYSDKCLDFIRAAGLKEADFYKASNKTLFREIMKMADRGEAVELNTVAADLQQSGLGERITPLLLAQLEGMAHPQDAQEQQIKKYVDLLKDFAARRKLVELSNQMAADAKDTNKDVAKIAAEIQDGITGATIHDERRAYKSMEENMFEYLETLGEREKGNTNNLKTGFIDLDNRCGGFKKGHFVVLAARPSMGKTALALNIITNVCKAGGKVAFFSMEMPVEDLEDRLIAAETKTNYRRLQHDHLTEAEWSDVYAKANEIQHWHLAIYTGRLTMAEVRTRAKLVRAKENGLDLIVIDHLQLIEAGQEKRYGSRVQELAEITSQLKDMALELNVPVLVLSQLSRAIEMRDDKRPTLPDLRDSGTIEQDADMVLALYRDAYYSGNNQDKSAELGIIKARGETRGGCIHLVWLGQYQKFESASGYKG